MRLKKILFLVVAFSFVMMLTAVAHADEGKLININTATVEELVTLDRIGPSYAERIVQYREANGSFAKPEDIMKVPGIGLKTFEVNKDRITVN